MPFKTFTASVLSSSDMNTYLMKQAVITCTSGTRPASPVQGMQIFETDTGLDAYYDGTGWVYKGGWIAYTPTLGNITIGNGTLTARYTKYGKTVNLQVRFAAGSTTTYSAGTLTISPPASLPVGGVSTGVFGAGLVANGTNPSQVSCVVALTSGNFFLAYTGASVSNTTPFTFGTASTLLFSATYETT